MTSLRRRFFTLGTGFCAAAWALAILPVDAVADPAQCLAEAGLTRIVRVRAPDGSSVYARIVSDEDGVPTTVSPVMDAFAPLSDVFDRASDPDVGDSEVWSIEADERSARICSPVQLSQARIDQETHVVVAVGLNYAAHAEEAGGGDVFLFPKPVEPSSPYAIVAPPAAVTLLDYEVELAYVLLSDIDLANLPKRDVFLDRTAFFVANDITDREAIITHAGYSGLGDGFVEAKGQPSFLPTGPWLVRGSDLFAALDACGADGLGIRLDVDEGDGFVNRQNATTAKMIIGPLALLDRIANQIETDGLRTLMPVTRENGIRHYPFAIRASEDSPPILPAGSLVLTGTPEGVAMNVPNIPGLVARALLRLRAPLEQLRQEELARAAEAAPGGYLAAGDRVRASIDGLGTQEFRIAGAGSPVPRDPCE